MSASQIYDENLTNVYSDLFGRLTTLQRISVLRSFTTQIHPKTPSFHTFFLTHLPSLLTTQSPQAIYNLRKAYLCVIHLSSSEDNQVKTRYINFGRALLWALDHAEELLSCNDESAELQFLKAVTTIFHLVESLCYREWGLDHPSVDHLQQQHEASPSDAVLSEHDPVYHPPPKVSSKSTDNRFTIDAPLYQVSHVEQIGTDFQQNDQTLNLYDSQNTSGDPTSTHALHPLLLGSSATPHQVIQTGLVTNNAQNSDTAHLPRPSQYIRNNGKNIMPGARIKETPNGCDIPFDLIVTESGENDILRICGLPIHHVRASYPDNTSFQYIPIQNIHLLSPHTDNSITEPDKHHALASVDMSTKVYETIINRLTEAYTARFPEGSHHFLVDYDIQCRVPEGRVRIKIPILEDCFVRVVHLLWFVEHPLQEALKMCQHDVSGCGLLKVEFVEAIESTRMVISLAGVVVERNWLNYGERIFELVDNGVASEL